MCWWNWCGILLNNDIVIVWNNIISSVTETSVVFLCVVLFYTPCAFGLCWNYMIIPRLCCTHCLWADVYFVLFGCICSLSVSLCLFLSLFISVSIPLPLSLPPPTLFSSFFLECDLCGIRFHLCLANCFCFKKKKKCVSVFLNVTACCNMLISDAFLVFLSVKK